MPLNYTELKDGEKIIEEYADNSSWFTRWNKLVSQSAGVAKWIENSDDLESPAVWIDTIYGTIFLTNKRIIFESLDGNTSESTTYKQIDSIIGNDESGAEPGNLIIYKKNGEYLLYVLHCAGTFSNIANKTFFNIDAPLMTGEDVWDYRKAIWAQDLERLLKYDTAILIWEELGKPEDAARVRKLKSEQGAVKVTQKVVHGDEVTKTEIKDSVLNRSNVGGSSKMQELEKLAEMKEKGLIDDDEFKQMKKEILGK